jgi:hypothetical protein
MGKGAGAGRRGKKPHAAGRQFDPRHLEKELHAERRTGIGEEYVHEAEDDAWVEVTEALPGDGSGRLFVSPATAERFPAELLAELNRPTPPKGYTVHHCGCAPKKDTKGPRDRYGRLK